MRSSSRIAALAGFRRAEHEQAIAEFRELDRRLIQHGAARVRAACGVAQGKAPPQAATTQAATTQAATTQAATTQAATTQAAETQAATAPAATTARSSCSLREANKKAKHLPLRRLFDEMPGLLARLKPCLLMSPLSVSQFLPADPEKLHFDVVVFDEASQLLPEDAIGAIYRGKQLVVTGDNQQLPPTTFFQQLAGDGRSGIDGGRAVVRERARHEPGGGTAAADAALALSQPARRADRVRQRDLLRRQAHHLPRAALPATSALGVQLPPRPGWRLRSRRPARQSARGAGRRRPHVLDHFRKTPEQTLGVIALSYAQMEAIEDELERQLREQPELERHFDGDRLGGFFVKNLETVQGDERDVIILSIGYGRDENGKLILNFGPLNRAGGERRLNVAVTRAREQLLVVSSIRAARHRAVAHFIGGPRPSAAIPRLRRARHAAALHAAAAVALPPTPLHEDVQRVLKEHGYDAIAHVGCGAVRIDLGVIKPDRADRLLLGIEFDGPAYAQAATARDRDRLRPEVLAKLGWRLHRIWAADWLHRRDDEVARLLAMLQD